jgi:hypothetical protein
MMTSGIATRMKRTMFMSVFVFVAANGFAVAQSVVRTDDDNLRPPVSKTDIEILDRAERILDSPAKWNRADNRVCPKCAKTVSLYCALEQATLEVTGSFEHRGAVMQEARFAIDKIDGNRDYDHRLMGYNNDKTTTFADIKKVIEETSTRIETRLKTEGSSKKER